MSKFKFKDLQFMTTAMMKAECNNYFKQYQKIVSMPSDILIRLNLLMAEIKRKENLELEEQRKSEIQKSYELQQKEKNEALEEIIELNKELTKLNMLVIRNKISSGKGSGDIDFKNKKE